MVPASVYPFNVGILATIPSAGVNWYFPPNGIITVFAPIVLSNLSTNPLCEQQFKSVMVSFHVFSISSTGFVAK